LGAALQERRSSNQVESQDAEEVYQDNIVEDDDAAVDLLTQTQHVSGRSEQDPQLDVNSQQTQSQKQSIETPIDNTFPESIEMYETQVDVLDITSQDEDVATDAEEQDDDGLAIDQSPERSPSAVVPTEQTNGNEGTPNDEDELDDKEGEQVAEEEEQEEEEEIEIVETQPMALNDEASVKEEEDARPPATAVEVAIDLEADENLETQPSWDIRKRRNGPVASGDIIREAANASR
jgi:hypothetical protein